MKLDLTGKTAVVTGASRGIGLAVAQALVREGVSVTAGSLNASAELTALADEGDLKVVLDDLTTTAGCQALVDTAVGEFGGIDILVNNVGGVRPRTDGFLEVTDADWLWALDVNLLSAVRATRAAVPHLLERAPAAITTICSVNATLPDPGVIDYSAAKGALTNLCKALSKELGPEIRVNTISPGPVRTDLWLGASGVAATVGGASGADPGDVVRRQEAEASTGRFTTPAEVADLVLFLASDRSGNTTGSDFLIDGGLVTTL